MQRLALLTVVAVVSYTLGVASAPLVRNTTDCLTFVRYVPSQWEDEWLYDSSRHQDICSTLQQEAFRAQTWLDVTEGQRPIRLHHREHAASFDIDSVWSKYIYQDKCGGVLKEIVATIEPAVGLLRSPHAEACSTDGLQTVPVENRDYILLGPPVVARHFPGRKLLLDIGTGKSFESSLQWLADSYEKQDIVFDEIWCWEAEQVDAITYWHSVPSKWKHILHFYNTYATIENDAEQGFSPVDLLEQVYTPGDFVVVKLDIDSEELETSILEQLLVNAHMVNEVFFEMHFDAPEMWPYFGQLQTTYKETLTLFRRFRNAGIRLHYWP